MSTDGMERPGAAERAQEAGVAALGRGGRMSRQRKRDAVLRLLRGEDLEMVFSYSGLGDQALRGLRCSGDGCACRVMVLSAVGMCRRMMVSEAPAS